MINPDININQLNSYKIKNYKDKGKVYLNVWNSINNQLLFNKSHHCI